jgi:hypothetical protein
MAGHLAGTGVRTVNAVPRPAVGDDEACPTTW